MREGGIQLQNSGLTPISGDGGNVQVTAADATECNSVISTRAVICACRGKDILIVTPIGERQFYAVPRGDIALSRNCSGSDTLPRRFARVCVGLNYVITIVGHPFHLTFHIRGAEVAASQRTAVSILM